METDAHASIMGGGLATIRWLSFYAVNWRVVPGEGCVQSHCWRPVCCAE